MIAHALGACGGAVATPEDGVATGAPTSTDGACPSAITASVGHACASDGTFCPAPACDPCTENCSAVRCVDGTWTTSVNTAVCTGTGGGADGGGSIDAGPADGGACVAIDTSAFDSSCKEDVDCVPASVGNFCPSGGSCMCAAATIKQTEQGRYDAYVKMQESQVTVGPRPPGPFPCSCPFFGTPRCALGHCALCGGASGESGCADGG